MDESLNASVAVTFKETSCDKSLEWRRKNVGGAEAKDVWGHGGGRQAAGLNYSRFTSQFGQDHHWIGKCGNWHSLWTWWKLQAASSSETTVSPMDQVFNFICFAWDRTMWFIPKRDEQIFVQPLALFISSCMLFVIFFFLVWTPLVLLHPRRGGHREWWFRARLLSSWITKITESCDDAICMIWNHFWNKYWSRDDGTLRCV